MMRRVIFIMVDGFGLPPTGLPESVYSECCLPEFIRLLETYAKPIDACLGVEGIPQSATGQTAMFCGVNASEIMRSHIQGFPGPVLRGVIRERNIFDSLRKKGKTVTFANAYVRYTLEKLKQLGFRSVTTVMTESVIGHVRGREELLAGNAVMHDLTRETLEDETIPRISPEKAAHDLLNVSNRYDFTLFEYFLTDRAGHKRNREFLAKVLDELSRFICELDKNLPDGTLLILTSDHGNCEDPNIKPHTKNPVPFLVRGKNRPDWSKVNSIIDIHDYIVEKVFAL